MMYCNCYEDFQNEQMDEASFQAHLKECKTCQAVLKADEKVMLLAGTLKKPVKVPGFWNEIQAGLLKEQKRERVLFPAAVYRIAAVLIIAVGLTSFFIIRPLIGSRGILGPASMALLEKREQAYIEAIDMLAEKANPQIREFDVALMLLYSERLRTIDDQIEECREALASNPANAHIRKYLFSALKQKKETLLEIMDVPQGETPGSEMI